MKKFVISALALLTTVIAAAQTMNVQVGNVVFQFPASQAGDMTYSNGGQTMTIMGRSFTVSDITKSYVDDTAFSDSTVQVVYNGSQATVYVAGNVAAYVEPTVSGAHVSIAQSSDVSASTCGEITYQLSGSSTDGDFYLSGKFKATVQLCGLDLTSACSSSDAGGAAINIANSKRIQLSVKKGTTNSLSDYAGGSQKACLYSKGQLQLQGNGTLNVVGNNNHAVKSASYITVKNLTLNVTSAVGDGINCEEYFLMKSGTVSVSGVGDDGLQCDYGDETALTGVTTDHEDEDTGNMYFEGGVLTVNVTATAAKGVKAAGDIAISDGTYNVTTTGNGEYDSDEQDAKGACGIKTDNDMTISGGTLTLKSTGSGGKCLKADGTLTVSGGSIDATATGSVYMYSSSITASPKAIKAGTKAAKSSSRETAPGGNWGGGGNRPGGGGSSDYNNYDYTGGLVVTGGTINAKSSSHEAIESKGTINISAGFVYAESNDDAINSASDFTITGGYVMGNSSGNDGLDANGDFYIKGGYVVAVASSSPEVGIDANSEAQKKLTISGGYVVAIGGLESGSTTTGMSTKSASVSKGRWYTLSSGGTAALLFKTPTNSQMPSSATICAPSTPSLSTASTPSAATFWNGYGATF